MGFRLQHQNLLRRQIQHIEISKGFDIKIQTLKYPVTLTCDIEKCNLEIIFNNGISRIFVANFITIA